QQEVYRKKLEAMQQKTQYLKGAAVQKFKFRAGLERAESDFEKKQTLGEASGALKDLIHSVSFEEVRKRRKENIQTLTHLLQNKNNLLSLEVDTAIFPMGMVFVFESQNKRDIFRQHLIDHNVYPAILWPQQKTKNAKDFSDRMLLVHCDLRYNSEDLQVIATIINQNNS